MSILCPHCGHTMNAKSIRAGKFKPKCVKCGRQFLLEVGEGANPAIRTSVLPGEASGAVFNPEATEVSVPSPTSPSIPVPAPEATLVAPEASAANNADFSVAASLLAAPASEQTLASSQTLAPVPAVAPEAAQESALDATEVASVSPVAPAAVSSRGDKLPQQLGGYQVVRELGRGGMGAVYLARQVSLDRPVALKVMNAQWAKNPNFLVRFTREAYAAAQLIHHNVVQVYDIGEDQGIHYFSMEFVEGQSLGELVKKEGKLAPEVAAGYILQAARGLQFAHERGMIHRDIKPDNLMLNTQGVVKVADLGLVRTPGMSDDPPPARSVAALEVPAAQVPIGRSLSSLSGVTLAGQAMGTPSYMAPEQARDASAVDGRADIYSLGCTLFVLITGRPVFKGRTAMEIMTRHATDPAPRPETVVRDVPRALGDIVQRMLCKRPEDRYADMGELIKALEDFLGLHAAKTATTEQHLGVLESSVRAFYASPLVRIRALALLGFTSACLVFCLLFLFISWWRLGTFFFAVGASTLVSYFLVRGSAERGYLFRKVRDLLLGSSWVDGLKMIGGLVVFVLGLFFLGLLPWWLLAVTLGVGMAFGLYLGIDKCIADQRRESLEKVERMLKTLRLRGLSEEALQEFVADFAGDSWEEFFEALFGYEAKIAQRGRFTAKPRSRHAAWREPVVAWIDRVQKARQEARERAHLQRVEQKNLEAQGISAGEARARAEQVAQAMVSAAAEMKKVAPADPDATLAPEPAPTATVPARKGPPPRRVNVAQLLEVVEQPRPAVTAPALRLDRLLAAPFGGGPRFLLACVLLVCSGFWAWSQNLIPGSDTLDQTSTWVSKYNEAKMKAGKVNLPFTLPLPEMVSKSVFSIGALAAGVLLLLSSLWYSWKIGIMQYLAAAVFLLGPTLGYLPETIMGLSPTDVSLTAGFALSFLGFLFGRDT